MFFFKFDDSEWLMDASELNRKLLFVGYEEATDYLNNSPLNRYLYKFFIDTLPQYQIEVPIVTFFNEIYYQCVRVNFDGTPGVDIEQRYIAEETEWVKSEQASKLIFSVVWALMTSKCNPTFHEECFLSKLTPYVKSCYFRLAAEQIVNDIRTLGLKVPEEYPTMAGDVRNLPLMNNEELAIACDYIYLNYYTESEKERKDKALRKYLESWKTVTTNYSHYSIEKYMRLFTETKIQFQIIRILELSSSRCQPSPEFDDYLQRLEGSISTGKFNPHYTPAIITDNPMGVTPDEYDEYRHNKDLDRALTDETLNKEEQLQRDCESLKRQLEEQQKSHEMEMARIVAKHQAEIMRLKKQNTEDKKQTTKKDKTQKAKEKTSSETDSQMFSVEEMIADVQKQFELTSAKDFCSMYYRIATKHGYWDEKICNLVDSIVPSIKERDAQHQTINIPTAQQVNISPKEVINQIKEE